MSNPIVDAAQQMLNQTVTTSRDWTELHAALVRAAVYEIAKIEENAQKADRRKEELRQEHRLSGRQNLPGDPTGTLIKLCENDTYLWRQFDGAQRYHGDRATAYATVALAVYNHMTLLRPPPPDPSIGRPPPEWRDDAP
jgi:hypothetical protein